MSNDPNVMDYRVIAIDILSHVHMQVMRILSRDKHDRDITWRLPMLIT